MKIKQFGIIVSLTFALAVVNTGHAQCPASTDNLITYYASNNGQRGCMFNITAAQDVIITCFDANLYAGTTADYEIYYRSGSYIGNETNAAAWTFVGGTTGLTSAGNNVATNIPIPVNVYIPAGQTYGFYVTNDFGAGTSYTDGTSATNNLGSDANITVYGGVGKSYPFGLTFSYREFNGTVHYNLGSPLDVSLSSFEAFSENRNVHLSWQTESEDNNAYFTLERSLNGENWEEAAVIDGAGTTTETKQYTFTDHNIQSKVVYYRLSQTDFDGTQSDYTVRGVKVEQSVQKNEIIIAPNPASDYAHLLLSNDDKGELIITDLSGKRVLIEYEQSTTGVILDVRNTKPGIYLVKSNEFSGLLQVTE
ncbi:MAG: T9SS type A sorting domain-containing protein [Fluviicola sp.]